MKNFIKCVCLGLAVAGFMTACSDDDSWNSDWDKDLTMNPETDLSTGQPAREMNPSHVAIEGKLVTLAQAKEILLAHKAAPAVKPVTVTVKTPGSLREAIGEDVFTMDALTVSGPLNAEDINYIRHCATSCRLRSVNLAKARMENDAMPDEGFITSEYPLDRGGVTERVASYVPIHTLVLPENLKSLGKYSLSNLLITEIDLPESVVSLNAYCLARTPMLGGSLTLDESMSIGTAALFRAGDGTLVIDYRKANVLNVFSEARIKEFNLAEGVVEVLEPFALSEIKGLTSLTLPRSIKSLGEFSLYRIPDLKTLNILFEDPSLASPTLEELIAGNSASPFGDLMKVDEEGGTPHDVAVTVPKGTLAAFTSENNAAWQWFKNMTEAD